jgi:hypothetical protein
MPVYHCSGCKAELEVVNFNIVTLNFFTQCCVADLQDEDGNAVTTAQIERWLDRGAMAQERE